MGDNRFEDDDASIKENFQVLSFNLIFLMGDYIFFFFFDSIHRYSSL